MQLDMATSGEYASIRPKSGWYSFSVKKIMSFDGLLGSLYFWAPVLCIFLQYVARLRPWGYYICFQTNIQLCLWNNKFYDCIWSNNT